MFHGTNSLDIFTSESISSLLAWGALFTGYIKEVMRWPLPPP